jgi:hypothetical protein
MTVYSIKPTLSMDQKPFLLSLKKHSDFLKKQELWKMLTLLKSTINTFSISPSKLTKNLPNNFKKVTKINYFFIYIKLSYIYNI